jgi:hypothetical protein
MPPVVIVYHPAQQVVALPTAARCHQRRGALWQGEVERSVAGQAVTAVLAPAQPAIIAAYAAAGIPEYPAAAAVSALSAAPLARRPTRKI